MLRQFSLCVFGILPFLALSAHAQSAATQPTAGNPYSAASSWTIGMITGDIGSTELRIANDLAKTLNDAPRLRIVPMIGESSIRNINDLLFLQGVDIAVIQSDVLSQLRRTKRMPGIEDRIHYIAKLHSEEFHVLSRMQYLCLADLSGRKVNFGPAGSGSAVTAEAVFEANKVEVRPVYMDHGRAIEKLKTGELDAMVFVSGKPSAAFREIRYMDRVHFLDVDFADSLQKEYLPAIMTHDDYPDLIAPSETVSTIAVSSVMAVFNSEEKSERHQKLSRFVESFFARFAELGQNSNHVKWNEFSASAPLNGWTRFAAAQKWLDQNQAALASQEVRSRSSPANDSSAEINQAFDEFARSRGISDETEKRQLFDEFRRWYQRQNSN